MFANPPVETAAIRPNHAAKMTLYTNNRCESQQVVGVTTG